MKRKVALSVMLTVLVISIISLKINIEIVEAQGTIYIRADGSIDPPTAPISRAGATYTFTADINKPIVIEKDNIIVNGNGYALKGVPPSYGFNLTNRINVTIMNVHIIEFSYGIYFESSTNITIDSNKLTNNDLSGVWLESSIGTNITNNVIENNYCGVLLTWADNNIIMNNSIRNNPFGIMLIASLSNSIRGNTVFNNTLSGIWLDRSNNNLIYHNNFINNTPQAEISSSINTWDDGYPSGGNYWSDYTGVDLKRGPNQDQPGSDGIWDHPYVIDANNKDRYPLVNPWTPTPTPPPNQPPNQPSWLFQYAADREIPVGGFIDVNTVTLFGVVSDPDGDRVKLQVELRRLDEYDGRFIGIPTHESEFVESDYGVTITVHGLILGYYHWQARTVDEQGLTSNWVSFGDNPEGAADFRVRVFQPPFAEGTHYSTPDVTGRFTGSVSNSWVRSDTGEGKTEVIVYAQFIGAAVASAEFTLYDSWKSGSFGTYTMVASFNISGIISLANVEFPPHPWPTGAFVSSALFKASFWVYDHTAGREVLRTEEIIFQDKIDWVDGIPLPKPKAVLYRDTPHTIHKLMNLQKGHEYTWYFKVEMEAEASAAGVAGGFVEGNILTELVEVSLRPLEWKAPPKPAPTVENLMYVAVASPINLLVVDPEGRRVGFDFISQQEVNEIPDAWYHRHGTMPQLIGIPRPVAGSYQVLLSGTGEGSYTLATVSFTEQTTTFTVTDIPISVNAIHQYVIDWDALSRGEEGVTVMVDSDGDGVFEHTFTSDSELTQSEFVVATDKTPPQTWLNIAEPKFVVNGTTYLTSATPIQLIAVDNPGGSGVASTAYRIYNATYDSGWITYTGPFHLTGLSDGTYQIEYNSTDFAGNIEPTKTFTITLFSWNYVFEDTYGRGTVLKINTEHKFFQFIRPSKDYGIKKATYMISRGDAIVIQHYDRNLWLVATANTKQDFCIATAYDLQTRKTYTLIDKPGIEK